MKRQRGRGRKSNGGGGGGQHHHHNRNFESNGPDIKIRGSASHVYEKYQQLARDASSSGDRVAEQSYLQHAEHYFRMMRAQQQHQQQNAPQQQNPQQNRPDDGGMRDYGGGNYQGGRDEYDDMPGQAETSQQPQSAAAGPSSPLDVVDPEAVDAAGAERGGEQRDERGGDEMRSRRRRRRRFEGQAPSSAPDMGNEAADTGGAFDRAAN